MSKEKREWRFLRISAELYNKLTDLGSKKDTYDDIIRRLYDFYIEHKEKEEAVCQKRE